MNETTDPGPTDAQQSARRLAGLSAVIGAVAGAIPAGLALVSAALAPLADFTDSPTREQLEREARHPTATRDAQVFLVALAIAIFFFCVWVSIRGMLWLNYRSTTDADRVWPFGVAIVTTLACILLPAAALKGISLIGNEALAEAPLIPLLFLLLSTLFLASNIRKPRRGLARSIEAGTVAVASAIITYLYYRAR